MRFRLSSAFLLVMLALVTGCGGDDEETPSGSAGFDTTLPDGWEEGTDAQLDQLTASTAASTAQALGVSEDQLTIEGEAFWFDRDAENGFATNVNVLSEEVPEGLSDQDFIDASLSSVAAIGAADTERATGPDIDGDASGQLDYSASPPGSPPDLQLRFRAVSFVHDGRGFTITLTAEQDRFEAATEDLDEIVAGWTWE